jgi:signal transduction histidine kinase
VEFQHSGLENRRFSSGIETAVYRVVQEALNNVARHAVAPSATVHVWADEDTIRAQVKDLGIGFDSTAALNTAVSSGLSGIRERVTLFGGEIAIESASGRGTWLSISLPVDGGGAK